MGEIVVLVDLRKTVLVALEEYEREVLVYEVQLKVFRDVIEAERFE